VLRPSSSPLRRRTRPAAPLPSSPSAVSRKSFPCTIRPDPRLANPFASWRLPCPLSSSSFSPERFEARDDRPDTAVLPSLLFGSGQREKDTPMCVSAPDLSDNAVRACTFFPQRVIGECPPPLPTCAYSPLSVRSKTCACPSASYPMPSHLPLSLVGGGETRRHVIPLASFSCGIVVAALQLDE